MTRSRFSSTGVYVAVRRISTSVNGDVIREQYLTCNADNFLHQPILRPLIFIRRLLVIHGKCFQLLGREVDPAFDRPEFDILVVPHDSFRILKGM
jgi:hypothetical protein